MNRKTLILLLILGYLILRKRQPKERFFRLPNGQVVPESQLPSLGYVNYQGYWIHQTKLNQATGGAYSAHNWQQILSHGFNFAGEAYNMWLLVKDLFNRGNLDNLILDPYDLEIIDPGPGGDQTGWG